MILLETAPARVWCIEWLRTPAQASTPDDWASAPFTLGRRKMLVWRKLELFAFGHVHQDISFQESPVSPGPCPAEMHVEKKQKTGLETPGHSSKRVLFASADKQPPWRAKNTGAAASAADTSSTATSAKGPSKHQTSPTKARRSTLLCIFSLVAYVQWSNSA